MHCTKLLHVNLRVTDIDKAVAFYGGVLGFESIKRGEKVGRGAWFRLGVAEVHLTEDDSPGPLSKRHFAIEVEDLAAARADVTASGASIEKEMSWRFWTRDPSGNRLEFVRAGGDPEAS